ncbi:AAA domain (dynein-related subfamily) domain-containing protein [Ditylenchus destructor]|uniref:AAA domain (Dynein-related subfamily) domain-containing protein n=1 Tax=Ditylenchus destructor TaxID=166010 RepID=A0AAD4R4Y3_9BILA|nr:AAA domain (dynein-related subfamily) domain-containing protein [Ditylenchus destructor]
MGRQCVFTAFGLLIRRNVHGTSANGYIRIGEVRAPVKNSKNPEFVPVGFADANPPARIVETIKWILQKANLNQDIFLLGSPGFLRSHVVLQTLELCNREYEYLTITRDTTEADIKQRREIRSGNVFYSDLCAVNAALNGRVLVIDGVEKAERNVLPILNNLLENREMQLDDGRFLMAASKFDKLLEKHSKEQLAEWKLERVSPDFQVIAMGLPVPLFSGHTLDPPLRSRFQARNMTHIPFGTMIQLGRALAPNIDESRLNALFTLVYALNSQNQKFSGVLKTKEEDKLRSVDLPLYPIDNCLKSLRVWNNNPDYSVEYLFGLCYPSRTILKNDTQQPVLEEFFEKFSVERDNSKKSVVRSLKLVDTKTESGFVSTPYLEGLVQDLVATHGQADYCLLGAKGSGKSTVISEVSRRINCPLETMVLYQDMNSRELFQQRRILDNGDTIWEDSQLVKAAKQGRICVLDGLERVHSSMVEALAPLIHHRFLQLPDGSRLLSFMQFDLLKAKTGLSDQELENIKIFKIADTFRLIGVADSESANSSQKWLNEQILCLFLFHTLKPMNMEDQLKIIHAVVPNVCSQTAKKLLNLVSSLRKSKDPSVRAISTSLSLRRIIFILRRNALNPEEGIYEAVERAALAKFLPSVIREAFESKLQSLGILPDRHKGNDLDESWKERLLNAKDASSEGNSFYEETMVPDIVFYDNVQHQRIISDMAKDFELGSHLLLIGNQGVGKNKIADRFLQLLNRPRQYMQLHRDTTVQSLTTQTTIVDGVLKHEDSPLVKAVRHGLVLVVDEADKAPLHVIAVLKSLLDTGVLYLSDGRKIHPPGMEPPDPKRSIVAHKGFQLLMLANRPGFPFLGNDLFGLLGDLFSVHVVDNPDRESEMVMLKKYGPDVPEETLNKLISVFGDLREMADQSILSYPYSTRELVNIVKHIQAFPNDDLETVIRNVFDFDSYSTDVIEIINETFAKHGINLGGTWWSRVIGAVGVSGDVPERIEFEKNISEFDISKLDQPKIGKFDPSNAPHHGGNTWAGGTGGYNTAGLGGVGGPFRLDAGHDVHQMPDSAKQQVPEHILKKAREIAKQEYAKRLKEIDMSQHDASAYNELYVKISKQVKMLKGIIGSLEAKEHERQWAKHQTSGDLDDGKLIEGMAGEKAIYRRRVSQPPEPGTVQTKSKRLRLCFDVSASMYRFNGYDQRLQKSLEAALLVMEAMEGSSDKLKYDIVGHSGDGPKIPFVRHNALPRNEKEKLDTLKRMLLHSQFCMSGDYTLEAIEIAINELKKETDVDERFVIALSDANLDRYGIRPAHLSRALTKEENVNAFLILIGSLGEQAQRIQRALPAGKTFRE